MKKIYILLGHPNKDTACGTFADSYEKGAREAGHEVHRTNLGDLHFDPILHKGYKEIQALEPDLIQIQEDIKWADHVVIIYPIWWSSMPALLKGMIDRMWLPGFAYNFNKGMMGGMFWNKRLKGKSMRVFQTYDSSPFIEVFLFGSSTNVLKRAVADFSGMRTHVTKVGNLKGIKEAKFNRLKSKFYELGLGGK
jgi:NAD(P)H dehydrogenase (quinone)